jgi:large subunit ribosomal protein L17
MKKGVKKTKLNRRKSHSDMILRDMFKALLKHGKIETVLARAKVLDKFSEKTIAHVVGWGNQTPITRIQGFLGDQEGAELLALYTEFVLSEGEKETGFTSLVRTRFRKGDNAPMAEVMLYRGEDFKEKYNIDAQQGSGKKGKKSRKRKKKKAIDKKIDKEVQKGKKAGVEDEGVISKIKGRLMGRKDKNVDSKDQRRARSRSGL